MHTREALAGIYGFLDSNEVIAIFLIHPPVRSESCSGLLGDGKGATAATIDSIPNRVGGVARFEGRLVREQTDEETREDGEAERCYQAAGATLDRASDPPTDSQDLFATEGDVIHDDRDGQTVRTSFSRTLGTLLAVLEQFVGVRRPGRGDRLMIGPSPAGVAG